MTSFPSYRFSFAKATKSSCFVAKQGRRLPLGALIGRGGFGSVHVGKFKGEYKCGAV